MTESKSLPKSNSNDEASYHKNGFGNLNHSTAAKSKEILSKPNGLSHKADTIVCQQKSSPFTITLHIDLIAWTCFLIAFLFRIYLIDYPPNIV